MAVPLTFWLGLFRLSDFLTFGLFGLFGVLEFWTFPTLDFFDFACLLARARVFAFSEFTKVLFLAQVYPRASCVQDVGLTPHIIKKRKKCLEDPNKSWKIGLSLSRS